MKAGGLIEDRLPESPDTITDKVITVIIATKYYSSRPREQDKKILERTDAKANSVKTPRTTPAHIRSTHLTYTNW
jgi:hypothetical protein